MLNTHWVIAIMQDMFTALIDAGLAFCHQAIVGSKRVFVQMCGDSWWAQALQVVAGIVGVVIAIALGAVALALLGAYHSRSQEAARLETGGEVLGHPRSSTVMNAVAATAFAASAILTFIYPRPGEAALPYVIVAGPLLLSVLGLLDTKRVHHELSKDGISYRGLSTRHDLIRWNELTLAKWKPGIKWLVLSTSDGRVLRISAMLFGLQGLATALLENAPELEASDETIEVLREASAGNLPDLWS